MQMLHSNFQSFVWFWKKRHISDILSSLCCHWWMLFFCFEGSKERCEGSSCSGEEENREGGESSVREASEAVWNSRSPPTEEGSHQVHQMASQCPDPEEEEDPQAVLEGSSDAQPVLQDSTKILVASPSLAFYLLCCFPFFLMLYDDFYRDSKLFTLIAPSWQPWSGILLL